MLQSLLDSFWFYLPVFLANMSPYLLASKIGKDPSLDFGKSLFHKRIIGDSRGYGGIILFLIVSIIVSLFQGRVIAGLYLGAGASFGTLLSSFIKRRIGFLQGDYFFLLDQLDFILGATVFYYSYEVIPLGIIICGCLLALILHHLVNLLRKFWESSINVNK